ncbi:MAG: YeeE/YedE family protein [Deltaproteobacteria bacterium]|nr:YeeE/YedE family protein [Deltaproteobacteria bacterium]
MKKSATAERLQGLFFGVIFGFLLQKGGATKYDVIIGQLLLYDFTVVKIMLSAVITGMIGIHWLRRQGWITFTPKAGSWGKNLLGGLIFGVGFALLGYCPGTIAGAVGNGSLDALIGGLPGILLGSALLAAVYPKLKTGILKKGDFGAMTLPQLLNMSEWAVILPLAAFLIFILCWIEAAGL